MDDRDVGILIIPHCGWQGAFEAVLVAKLAGFEKFVRRSFRRPWGWLCRMGSSPLNNAVKQGNSLVLDVQASAEIEGSREVFHELDLNTMEALLDRGEQFCVMCAQKRACQEQAERPLYSAPQIEWSFCCCL